MTSPVTFNLQASRIFSIHNCMKAVTTSVYLVTKRWNTLHK